MGTSKATPMDSGFSWVVLACSFLSLYVFCFMNSAAGILQVEIMEDLQVGSGVVSIMTATALGMSTLLGPLGGVLSNLFSIRYTVYLGVVLLSVGMLLGSFSESIGAMMFFYGIMAGAGLGISYCPCVVVISLYFEKRHIMANGIIFCASGLGTLSVPYMVRYVIDNYGWRYSMALNAAIVLHILVFASFFRPTELEKRRMVKLSLSDCCSRTADASIDGGSDVIDDEGEGIDTDQQAGVIGSHSQITRPDVVLSVKEDINSVGGQSQKRTPSRLMVNSEVTFGDTYSLGSGKHLHNNISSSPKSISATRKQPPYVPVFINGTSGSNKNIPLRSPVADLIVSESSWTGYSLSSEDVYLQSRLSGLSPPARERSASQLSSHSFIVSSIDVNRASSGGDNPRNVRSKLLSPTLPLKAGRFGELRRERSLLSSSLRFASSEFGSSVLLPIKIEAILPPEEEEDISLKATLGRVRRSKPMWVMCVHCFFFMSGCGMHAVHFPAYVASKGLPASYVSHFYTVNGVIMLAGRLFGGIIFNKIKPPLLPLMFVLEVVNGLVLGLAPFYASNPTGIFVFEGLLAMSYGQSYMLQAPLVATMVPIEDLSIAFGVTQLFSGIGFVSAPTLAGFIYDVTKTYDIPMHMAGSFILMGSVALLVMRWLDKTGSDKASTSSGDEEMAQDGDDEEEKTALNGGHEDRGKPDAPKPPEMDELGMPNVADVDDVDEEKKTVDGDETKPPKEVIREIGS